MKVRKSLAAAAVLLSLVFGVHASDSGVSSITGGTTGCVNAKVMSSKLITDVCWKCVMPIRVAGVPVSGKTNADQTPYDEEVQPPQPFCMCFDNLGMPKPGVATSFWQPSHMIEYERVPGCMSALNGARLPFDRLFQGRDQAAMQSENPRDLTTFRHYHFYAFPVMLMLDVFVPARCNPGGYHDFDIMYLSEIDPTWNNDEIAFFTNPEAALVATPVAVVACLPDAVSSNVRYPIQKLFWCAGSWGTLYPLSGNVYAKDGTPRVTSLMGARVLAQLHRRGVMWATMGREYQCGGEIMPQLPKKQYRFSMFYPNPETGRAHVLGESTTIWGWNRTVPATGEDPVYLIWRWLDCCNS